jgi:2,4-dienoyl-CoA reductase-like NADH-dependent reductase (Old Yellow Enzyme family)
MYDKLFEKYNLNKTIDLQNRIVMAPMTRCAADDNLVPTEDMVKYYEKRADTGLIIAEATLISKEAQGYPNQPGIFTQKQINGWKKITSKVHKKGAKIFSQIFHAGRLSHSIYTDQQPTAPSAVQFNERMPRSELMYEKPKELTNKEIKLLIQEFTQAASNSIKADFDGVEIHAANGYILDQFLHQDTNRRNDEYGGTPENSARIILEIIDNLIAKIGKDRVGLRISPYSYLHMKHTDGDEKISTYLLKEVEKRNIAYVHTGTYDDNEIIDYLDGKVSEYIRNNYNGIVIANGSYSAKEGNDFLKNNKFDLFAIGRSFIANPDLISKLKNNEKLVSYDSSMLNTLI